jgi:hypothetical protein
MSGCIQVGRESPVPCLLTVIEPYSTRLTYRLQAKE